MEGEKVYEYVTKYTKKDGTVVEYKARKKYIPKVKEVRKGDIVTAIKFIDDQTKLKQIKDFIDKITGKGEQAENGDQLQQPND